MSHNKRTTDINLAREKYNVKLKDVKYMKCTGELANNYVDYMNFRANKENTKHELEWEFYMGHLMFDCPSFFGIYHDGKVITKDIQNPEAFEEWSRII